MASKGGKKAYKQGTIVMDIEHLQEARRSGHSVESRIFGLVLLLLFCVLTAVVPCRRCGVATHSTPQVAPRAAAITSPARVLHPTVMMRTPPTTPATWRTQRTTARVSSIGSITTWRGARSIISLSCVSLICSSSDVLSPPLHTGGYHPVRLGEKFKHGRYVVLKKLGWGHFSTVWLVLDTHNNTFAALKVRRHQGCSPATACTCIHA